MVLKYLRTRQIHKKQQLKNGEKKIFLLSFFIFIFIFLFLLFLFSFLFSSFLLSFFFNSYFLFFFFLFLILFFFFFQILCHNSQGRLYDRLIHKLSYAPHYLPLLHHILFDFIRFSCLSFSSFYIFYIAPFGED